MKALLRDAFSREKLRAALSLLLLALLFACAWKTPVNTLTERLLPRRSVTITAERAENSAGGVSGVTLLNASGDARSLFALCAEAADDAWTLQEETPGRLYDRLLGADGATVTVSCPASPQRFLIFLFNADSGSVTVEADGRVQTIDLHDESGGGWRFVYPFGHSLPELAIKAACYLVLFLAAAAALLALHRALQSEHRAKTLLRRRFSPRLFVPIWLLLYLWAVLQYKVIGIPEFLTFGDQAGYWEAGGLLSAASNELEILTSRASFRGYWNYVLQWLSHAAGSRLGVDPVLVYFVFPSFTMSWLGAVVFPGLYRAFCGREASLLQALTGLAAPLLFWNGFLTGVLMDLYGATCFFTSVLFGLRAMRRRRLSDAVPAGLAAALSVSFRTAYLYGICALLAAGLVFCLRRRRSGEAGRDELRFALLSGGTALLAFLLLSAPQLYLNLQRGHFGFLPYDSDGAYLGMREMQFHANSGFRGYMAYPTLSDAQLASMSAQPYPVYGMSWISIEQVLTGYMYSPAEALMTILKHLFVLMDVKTPYAYPMDVNRNMHFDWRGTPGLLFSLLNYLVLLSALWLLLAKQNTNRRERTFALLVFLSLVLPMTFLLVEQRFALPFYFVLYYVFAYHFVGEILPDGAACRRLGAGGCLPLLALGSLLCLTVSTTFWAWIEL